MNDRYLFRGKRVDNGEWVSGYAAHNTDVIHTAYIIKWFGGIGTCCDDCGSSAMEFYEVDPATVGQCTGLREKNGTLIFEGDVLELDNKYHPNKGYTSTILISWARNAWCCSYPKARDRKNTSCIKANTFLPIESYELANYAHILGNVHDNSELLDEEN